MATVEFRYDPKNTAWFTANAAMVLKAGEPAYHDTTGLFKLGDGVTALSALSFLPTVSASTPTIQQVLTAGQVATTTIETTGFIKTGGLSTQFLKADGTVDSTVYGVGNALTTNPLSQFAATTSAQLAGVISDETGTGALVFGTSPTFTTDITTPQITGVSGVNGLRIITNNTASGAIARGVHHTPTLVAAANGDQLTSLDISPTFTNGAFTSVNNLALTMAMGTASIKMGNLSTTTTLAAIYFNQATPNSTNYTLQGSTTAVTLNNTTAVNIAINTTPILSANSSGAWNANAIAVTSGAVSSFNFTSPAHTNQTATTNIPNFRILGANKQWATGTVPLQYFNHLTANTVSAVGASTFTNVYGLYVEAATAGTNATITNNWAIGTNGDIQIGGNQIVFNAASNAYLRNTAGNLRLSCGIGARVAIDANGSLVGSFTSALTSITTTTLNLTGTTTIAGDTTINSAAGSSLTVTSAVRNAGVRTLFTLIGSADINQTTGTEVNRILWTAGSKTWATGNITNQREFLITSPTYNFNGTSTITNAYNAYFEAPIAGTNATITNNYALGLAGSLKINNTFNIVFDTTTGSKIGTATTQKLSFWNATPIVQPTTAVAAATVVSGTGSTVKHDDTFDGYTVEKIVRALRTIGLLA